MDQGLLLTLFIVLRKAFDSVDHNLLVNKLESYGLLKKHWTELVQKLFILPQASC